MDHHTVAAVSITGTCLDVLGSLYLAYGFAVISVLVGVVGCEGHVGEIWRACYFEDMAPP
jgi:hypothetical protein